MISPTQRLLPHNTQHSQETDIHAPGGIRTQNPSKRAASDPRLRQRGHRDGQVTDITTTTTTTTTATTTTRYHPCVGIYNYMYLKQAVFLGYIVLQLFCIYNLFHVMLFLQLIYYYYYYYYYYYCT
jgi:hypothetical protein